MTPNIIHPLIEFVYRTFGERFGSLLLAGYSEAAPPKKRTFLFTEHYAGVEIDWMVEVISECPPRGEEPLILAGILKLMLSQMPITGPFYFEMADLMAELDWPHTRALQDFVDLIAEKYAGLIFRKYEQRRRQRYKVAEAQWGRYKLVSSYLLGAAKEPGEPRLTRTFNRIDFDTKFVKGLNEGRVTFAGINFNFIE